MAITLLAKIANLSSLGQSLLGNSTSKIGEIAIDCSHSEIIEYANEITDHPIESGASVTDHVYRKPLRIRLEGSIIDAPVNVIGAVTNAVGFLQGNIFDNVTNAFSGKGRRELTAFEALQDINANKAPVAVVCYWNSYENMIIETLTIPRTGKTGGCLYFEATLKQTSYADVQFVDISNNPRNVRDVISSKVNLGKKQTLEPTVEQRRHASQTASIINYAGR
jgi:hypothetical protein